MKIIIEAVTSGEAESAMWRVRRDVFEREMGIKLAPDGAREDGKISHLIARVHPGREAVGTLSVIDTSGDERLHESHNLGFEPGARVPPFTHPAVLRPRRATAIPEMTSIEA